MFFLIRKIVLGAIFVVVLIGLIAVARGYQFSPTQKSLKSTGILVASSFPVGSEIWVNGVLKGATNSNITVAPGDYDIEIKKDGYNSWKKRLKIKGEIVVKADALLFPQNPSLSPITSLGITKAFASGSGDKIVIISETDNAEKDGVYLFENVRNPISRINPLKPLVLKTSFPSTLDISTAQVEFSPDEEQILLSFYVSPIPTPTLKKSKTQDSIQAAPEATAIYLIDTGKLTSQPFNVTESVATIHDAWEADQQILMKKEFAAFKKPLAQIAQSAFDIFAFSPDERKILYTATQSATLPQIIVPPLIATNQTVEERNIEPGYIYLYDEEEDKNFKLFDLSEFGTLEQARSSLLWYPDSAHIVIKEADKFSVVDYDGSNRRTVYSGPFDKSFAAMSKDGKVFILTNFNSQSGSLFDMYSIGLK